MYAKMTAGMMAFKMDTIQKNMGQLEYFSREYLGFRVTPYFPACSDATQASTWIFIADSKGTRREERSSGESRSDER